MRCSRCLPRVYKLAKSPGFEQKKSMPSRVFFPDESQGDRIVAIAKNCRTCTSDHGKASDRSDRTWGQPDLLERLQAQRTDNRDRIALETATGIMAGAQERRLPF
jgi:hypothetical protein